MAQNVGNCLALPSTKKYLSYDFTAPYPKDVTLSCKYICKSESRIEEITAIRTVTITNQRTEGLNLVCRGIIVKDGRWGFEFDKVQPFFVFDTNMIEIREWAFAEGLEKDGPGSELLMENLIQSFKQISASYKIAGTTNMPTSIYFGEAANILLRMVNELPNNKATLDYYTQRLELTNGHITNQINSENLVLRLVSTFSKWRISLH